MTLDFPITVRNSVTISKCFTVRLIPPGAVASTELVAELSRHLLVRHPFSPAKRVAKRLGRDGRF